MCDGGCHHRNKTAPSATEGFTLIELLIVVAIIALLIAILTPTLTRAQSAAREARCLASVHAQLRALHQYAAERDGQLASGSDNSLRYAGQAPLGPISSFASFQFWLGINQEPAALGVLLSTGYLSGQSLFCPDDRSAEPTLALARFDSRSAENAWCSYLYRQLDGQASTPPRTRLGDLGLNPNGDPVAALILDAHCTMVWDGLPLKSAHGGTRSALGLASGAALMVPDDNGALTLNGPTGATFTRLDQILEAADALAR